LNQPGTNLIEEDVFAIADLCGKALQMAVLADAVLET
jgi:hypothetical protein